MPGITIDPETGWCQYCTNTARRPDQSAEVHRILRERRGRGDYDAVFALSGGKDSCYTLYHLKERYPDLRILAVQFDHGFITDSAIRNAREFCRMTGSAYDSLTLNEEILRDAFCKAASSLNGYPLISRLRASDICNTCIGIIKQKLIERALVEEAPLIIFAFSPGQTENPFIPLSRGSLRWFRALFQKELRTMGITSPDAFLIREDLLKEEVDLVMVHPLLAWDYDKRRVEQECTDLGWKRPDRADRISTNCLLNAYAIDNHLRKYGIHPYAFDLAALVRNGQMTREEAIQSIDSPLPSDLIRAVEEKLHCPPASFWKD
jgi:tRNA(Ile)-lysidine synthase TilS/MesJ